MVVLPVGVCYKNPMRTTLLLALLATLAVAAERRDHRGREPKDQVVRFAATNNVTRVVFSHERHFGALNSKDCDLCHADKLGLGEGKPFPSRAPVAMREPHAEKSVGRFCANCHAGKVAFTAFGQKGDAGCERCHVPADHGADYTRRHGHDAERSATHCGACHRGSNRLTPDDLKQAQAYREAQATLAQNPKDARAAAVVLPRNFCAYCHARDQKAWRKDN